MSLKIELVLHIDPVFDEILSKSGEGCEGCSIRCASTAPDREVGIIDDQTVVVRAIERIVEGYAKLFDQIMSLLGGRIKETVPTCDFKLAGNDVFPDLYVPPIGLAEIDLGTDWLCGGVERDSPAIMIPYPLVAVVPFGL